MLGIAQSFLSGLLLELKASRATAWTHIASRKHDIQKVFAGSVDSVGSDIMMLGRLDLGLRNGNSLSMDFISRFVLEDTFSVKPKIALCQVWAVRAPVS